MSEEQLSETSSSSRGVPRRWVFIGAGALVLVMVVIVVATVLVDRSHDSARRAAAEAATSTTGITTPYDLHELPADLVDLDQVEDASLISITLIDENGKLTSYGITTELAAAQALIEAVKHSDGVPHGSSLPAETTLPATLGPTITFMFPSRDTLTFSLDLESGLIWRGEVGWKPDGDLRNLVETAIASPR